MNIPPASRVGLWDTIHLYTINRFQTLITTIIQLMVFNINFIFMLLHLNVGLCLKVKTWRWWMLYELMRFVFTRWSNIVHGLTIFTFKCSVAEKSLRCDFTSSYACGYQPLVEGRIKWERTNVKYGDQYLSPSVDASGNSQGRLFCALNIQ